ncbi:hypothetical protein HMP0015_1221, partial [Acinetobacter haemolyticus ATCC 19194]
PSSYALRHPIGELLVQYASSDYVEPTATGGDYKKRKSFIFVQVSQSKAWATRHNKL